MAKQTKLVLKRTLNCDWCYFCTQVDSMILATPTFCWSKLERVCPELCKGLRPGQRRELILRRTKRGITLTRPPSRSKKAKKANPVSSQEAQG